VVDTQPQLHNICGKQQSMVEQMQCSLRMIIITSDLNLWVSLVLRHQEAFHFSLLALVVPLCTPLMQQFREVNTEATSNMAS
jgi:hypothetical protein